MRSKLPLLLLLISALACRSAPLASFDEALEAYEAKDFSRASTEARKASSAGDARADLLLGIMLQNGLGMPADPEEAVRHLEKADRAGLVGAAVGLAQAYTQGAGVSRDLDEAARHGRRAAAAGDAAGAFWLSIALQQRHLSYLDAEGKVDYERYSQLAKRPLSERGIDSEARDALYWSAEQGHPLAMLSLVMTLSGTIGDDNRDRMRAWIGKLPENANPALPKFLQISDFMDSLGESYTSPQLFFDAQGQQMLSGSIKTCGLQAGENTEKRSEPRLVATSISKPLRNPVFLPSKLPAYERAYLVSGEWQETWTYTGCDKTASVVVDFTADGFGGARYRSETAVPSE